MIKVIHTGNWSRTTAFMLRVKNLFHTGVFDKYGQMGVDALSRATPNDSGETSQSWFYKVKINAESASIYWGNDNVNDGVNIAVILQYGHGTGTGGYVEGQDYINPALRPIFDEMANSIWREVIK